MKIWLLTLNGKEGMVFLTGHPESRYNIDAGIYLDQGRPPAGKPDNAG